MQIPRREPYGTYYFGVNNLKLFCIVIFALDI